MASAHDLNKGSCFEYKGEVLRVIKKEVVTVGTHSHTKLKLYVKPAIADGGEKTVILAHQDKVELCEIIKKTGTVVSKTQDKVQVMDSYSYETHDSDVSKELLDSLNEGDEVIFVEYKGIVNILEKKI